MCPCFFVQLLKRNCDTNLASRLFNYPQPYVASSSSVYQELTTYSYTQCRNRMAGQNAPAFQESVCHPLGLRSTLFWHHSLDDWGLDASVYLGMSWSSGTILATRVSMLILLKCLEPEVSAVKDLRFIPFDDRTFKLISFLSWSLSIIPSSNAQTL